MTALSLSKIDPTRSVLEQAIVEERAMLGGHPLFARLTTIHRLKLFMEYHVWCVWDFMALLKSLQLGIARNDVAWTPANSSTMLALINEIVASEETDIGPTGERASHFEIYLGAMRELSCDTSLIEEFVDRIRHRESPIGAMTAVGAPESAIEFVSTTLRFTKAPLHSRAAALCLGREELVPLLLIQLRKHEWFHREAATFRWYVERHIELDSGAHGPASAQLADAAICGSSTRWAASLKTGLEALRARRMYLNLIDAELRHRRRQERSSGTAVTA